MTSLQRGAIYQEGTVNQLIELTGWSGKSILYFGDQIYADLADITLFHGWRTGAIITELEKEVETLNSDTFRETICELQAIQALIDEEQRVKERRTSTSGQPSELMEALLEDRTVLRQQTKALFNPQFGSIFRTHHNPTYFSRRLFRYSDIYMSCLTNLLNYSTDHIFSPRRGALPHEKMAPKTQLLDEEE